MVSCYPQERKHHVRGVATEIAESVKPHRSFEPQDELCPRAAVFDSGCTVHDLSRHDAQDKDSTAQHSTAQHSTAQHRPAQRTAQQSTTQHSTAQHAQHSTAQHSTAQHSTAQHSTHRATQADKHGVCRISITSTPPP
jgi:hypothetical protein